MDNNITLTMTQSLRRIWPSTPTDTSQLFVDTFRWQFQRCSPSYLSPHLKLDFPALVPSFLITPLSSSRSLKAAASSSSCMAAPWLSPLSLSTALAFCFPWPHPISGFPSLNLAVPSLYSTIATSVSSPWCPLPLLAQKIFMLFHKCRIFPKTSLRQPHYCPTNRSLNFLYWDNYINPEVL